MENLMLSKKQISDLWDEMEKTDPLQKEMSWDDRLQIALLNHLKGLQVIYVKVDKHYEPCPYNSPQCSSEAVARCQEMFDKGYCVNERNCNCGEYIQEYIPLSEYE